MLLPSRTDVSWFHDYVLGKAEVRFLRGRLKFTDKAYEEAQTGTTIVMLLPSRTDVSWFHDYVLGKAEVRFLRGRLKFTDDEGNSKNSAPFPSLVAIYRKTAQEP